MHKAIRYVSGAALALWTIVLASAAILSLDLSRGVSPACSYEAREIDSKPFVSYECSSREPSVQKWKNNLRILNKFIVYQGSFACLIFTDGLGSWDAEGSSIGRAMFLGQMHLHSQLLAVAAQTAEAAPNIKDGIALRSKIWAMQFRLTQYAMEGPLKWTSPAANGSLVPWIGLYLMTTRLSEWAFQDMCETFAEFEGACYLPEQIPSAYIQEVVNQSSDNRCSLN